MQFVVALVAKPHQAVLHGGALSLAFNHQPQRPRLPHRAVGHACRVQIHVARAEFHVHGLAIFLDADGDLAFQLVEQLLRLVVVVILAGVGAGHNHDDVIATFHVEVLVPHGGLQQLAVLFNPRGQIEWFPNGHASKVRQPTSGRTPPSRRHTDEPNAGGDDRGAPRLKPAHVRHVIRPAQARGKPHHGADQ